MFSLGRPPPLTLSERVARLLPHNSSSLVFISPFSFCCLRLTPRHSCFLPLSRPPSLAVSSSLCPLLCHCVLDSVSLCLRHGEGRVGLQVNNSTPVVLLLYFVCFIAYSLPPPRPLAVYLVLPLSGPFLCSGALCISMFQIAE